MTKAVKPRRALKEPCEIAMDLTWRQKMVLRECAKKRSQPCEYALDKVMFHGKDLRTAWGMARRRYPLLKKTLWRHYTITPLGVEVYVCLVRQRPDLFPDYSLKA